MDQIIARKVSTLTGKLVLEIPLKIHSSEASCRQKLCVELFYYLNL